MPAPETLVIGRHELRALAHPAIFSRNARHADELPKAFQVLGLVPVDVLEDLLQLQGAAQRSPPRFETLRPDVFAGAPRAPCAVRRRQAIHALPKNPAAIFDRARCGEAGRVEAA